MHIDEVEVVQRIVRESDSRLAALDTLREQEARYHRHVANAPGLVYQLGARQDGTLSFTFVSDGAHAILGIAPEAILHDPGALFERVHPADRSGFLASGVASTAAQGELARRHWHGRVVRPTGEERWVQMEARPDRLPDGGIVYDGLLVDVTDLRPAASPPDVEAMGRLVGGVAHDLKNLLTAMSGVAELLLDDLAPGDTRRADVEQILGRTHLAAGLTRQLLALGRQQVLLHPEPVDLSDVITAAAPSLRSLLGTAVHLVVLPAPTSVPVRAHQTQIERVLMNLALNARDAMPEGGTLSIEVGVAARGAAAGPSATLRVSDTGEGMSPEVQTRLFEPLFTTKPPGRGTGLGLPIVQGIVQQAGGTIGVASRTGAGTAVTIMLPLAETELTEAMADQVVVAV